ncbi:transmembrane and immunoglobulin domain-containing protein 1 [Hyla sarda]|uniref:transmembrane and immunoglobulin domain-containing protein 1 n=1 Tax=Hyla sarda TaxID=327740 RepID=UPI0024C2141A|nr:transmembrane and immunoglobulin domain-containing protein 1 [Hyla sarda]
MNRLKNTNISTSQTQLNGSSLGSSPKLRVRMKNPLVLLAVLLPLFPESTAIQLLMNNASYDNRFTAPLNDSTVLRCEVVNNTNDETLIWYRGTQQVDIQSENSVNISNVCIPALTIEDNGVSFTCLLKRDTTIKRSVELSVLFSPVLSGDTYITVEEGQTIHITCGFKANPAAAMFWRQNGSMFTLPSRYTQDMASDTLKLTIEKAVKTDSANYTCVALLPNGDETIRVFELIVGDRKPTLPVEAIAAAVVVGALIIAFGLFARRDSIMCKKKDQLDTAM